MQMGTGTFCSNERRATQSLLGNNVPVPIFELFARARGHRAVWNDRKRVYTIFRTAFSRKCEKARSSRLRAVEACSRDFSSLMRSYASKTGCEIGPFPRKSYTAIWAGVPLLTAHCLLLTVINIVRRREPACGLGAEVGIVRVHRAQRLAPHDVVVELGVEDDAGGAIDLWKW